MKGKPEAVRVHDFKDKKKGKVTPRGVYDLTRNEGRVSVGIDHDTAEFAVDSFRHWVVAHGPTGVSPGQGIADPRPIPGAATTTGRHYGSTNYRNLIASTRTSKGLTIQANLNGKS